jgi:hypothetical protein
MANDSSFGSPFERLFVAALAILTGAVLVYLAVQGPLVRGAVTYKTAAVISNQLIGQDVVNLVVLSPLLFIGGTGLLLGRRWAASPGRHYIKRAFFGAGTVFGGPPYSSACSVRLMISSWRSALQSTK